MNEQNTRSGCGCAARRKKLMGGLDKAMEVFRMATRGDLKTQQEKLRVKAELLATKVKKQEIAEKEKDLQNRLRRMGGR